MATINNTIYPPIMPTYQKAFLKEETSNVLFNIQFNISEYTTITDVQTIEVKVMTLEGNHSILKGDHYFVSAEGVINTITRTGSIDILRSDTIVDSNENVDINYGQFYIVQLRLSPDNCMDFGGDSHLKIENGDTTQQKESQNNFLTTDVLERFSEWSTMSMIKCIDTPVLDLMSGQITLSKTNRVKDMSDISGYLQWLNKDSSEYLYSYRFRVYNVNDIPSKYSNDYDTLFREVEPLEDSGEIRTSTASPNRLHYIFRSNFIDGTRYRMFISYETDNEYSKIEYFNFYIQNFISSSNLAGAHAQISAFANNEIGGNELTLTLDDSYLSVPSKYLVFRRSSSDSDFKLWDDIHTVRLNNKNVVVDPLTGSSYLRYEWVDYTAEQGVFYKYCLQEVDLVGNRAEKIIAKNYRYTEDYYCSVMEYLNLDTIVVDKKNLLADVSYSLETEVDDSFWNQDLVDKSSFVSSSFLIEEPENYQLTVPIFSSYDQKIQVKIEDVNKPGTYIKQQVVNLNRNEYKKIDIIFSTLIPQTLRVIIEIQVEEVGLSSIVLNDIELHNVAYREIKQERELIDNLILDFNYTYLINDKNTLQLKYDTNISSITKTRKDTITETLNSKYPFIYRSGEIEYDSYNIEGTISILGDLYTKFSQIELQDSLSSLEIEDTRVKLPDVANIFANEQQLLQYDDIYQMYYKYQQEYNLNLENDYNIEKLFRKKVEAFLTDGSPKLFKNVSLGNKLVMLTDVSLSPKDTVGDKIYTFSATMTEIDDATVENYNLYNIINLDNWQDNLISSNTTIEDIVNEVENTVGQYVYIPHDKESEIVNVFEEIKSRYDVKNTNYIRTISHLYKIKIDLSELIYPLQEGVMGQAIINDKVFIISENNPYLELENIDISSFTLETNRKNDENKVVIDYLTKMSTLLVYATEGWVSTAENQLGQIYKLYTDTDNNIYEDIYMKYYYEDKDVMTKSVSDISKLLIQAYSDTDTLVPYENVIIEVEDQKSNEDKDDSPYIHVTDKKGIIDLYDEKRERLIKNILFKGVKVKLAEDADNPKINEYTSISDQVFVNKESLLKFEEPVEHTIYRVGKLNLAFYYNDKKLDYNTTVKNDLLDIEINTKGFTPQEIESVSEAIYQQLHNGQMNLDLYDDKTDKYIYINNHFYKIDNENCIQTPVWLKVTYLFGYNTRKKVD